MPPDKNTPQGAAKPHYKNVKGFTLIELIISLAILGIIIVPLAGFFTASIRINTDAKDKLAASQLAQQYMEKARNIPVGILDWGVGYSSTDLSDDGRYTVKTNVEPYAGEDYKIEQGSADSYDMKLTFKSRSAPSQNINDITVTASTGSFSLDGIPNGTASPPAPAYIKLDLSSTTLTLSYGGVSRSLPLPSRPDGDAIKLQVVCGESTDSIFLVVNNNSSATAGIYVTKPSGSSGQVGVLPQLGSVKVYSNIYDNTVANYDTNMVYKITVSVSKGSVYDETKKLAELTSLKTQHEG